ncbi:MAG: hypothetical protein ACRBK7_01675 [Acidimicrobiales bacterium]
MGLLFGLLLGLGLPPLLFGMMLAILSSTDRPGLNIIISLAVAVVVPIGAFVLLVKQMNRKDASQSAVRTALVVAGYTSLGIWVVLSILVGACFALLAAAYGA